MIEANKLTKLYGKHKAVDAIDFTIGKGEIIGFLGPNGAGKSTTMNMITGYLAPSSGSVLVDGLDVTESQTEVKKKIGYLPELPPLYPEMTVLEYLRFVGGLKKVDKQRLKSHLDTILEQVKIEDVGKRLIANLSKGYRQRVGIAQALVGSPDLLILDEPSVGLDPAQIIEIRNLIMELKGKHTIILSSHILPEVSAVCDRVLIINKGRIVASDTPDNLARRMEGASRIHLKVKGQAEKIEEAFKSMKSVTNLVSEDGESKGICDVSLEAEGDRDIREEVFRLMCRHDLPILQMRPIDMSLEDIFLNLTTAEGGE